MEAERTYRLGEFSCTTVFCTPDEALAHPGPAKHIRITDEHVAACLGVEDGDHTLVLAPGEEAKTWDHVQACIAKALELGLARDDAFMGIGGGVVTDLTAFAASVYLRGARLVLVPTTLLAMVDAAFGGKTGMNFGGYKNMVGTFYPAHELRICPAFVGTLPEAEYRSGLAEVIKSAALGDKELWDLLTRDRDAVLARDSRVVDRMVRGSLGVKAAIVEADLRETSSRAYLNLGHTFGHALESVAGFGTWSHGEAVAWGMVKALQLSVRLGHCSATWLHELRTMVEAYGFRTTTSEDATSLLAAMKVDKKKKGGAVRFVLQRGLCDTFTSPVDDADVLAVLAEE